MGNLLPKDTDVSHLAYKAHRNKDGMIVVNRFGHITAANLTDDDKALIDKLVAEGKPKTHIVTEVRTTIKRLNEYLEKKGTSDRIATYQIMNVVGPQLQALTETNAALLDIIKKMESRLSQVQTELRNVEAKTARLQIGRQRVERQRRSQRQEINSLRQQYWKRTGQKPM